MGLFSRRKETSPPLALRGGRVWRPEGIERADLLLADGIIAEIGEIETPTDAATIDLDGLLVTPGLIDVCRPLADDGLPPACPGPFLDRHRREEEIMAEPPVEWQDAPPEKERALAAAIACLREGITSVAGPPVAGDLPLRIVKTEWIASLIWHKNPARVFAKANGKPVLVSTADGTSRAAGREVEKLVELEMMAPNLLAVGGAGLTASTASTLAQAGAFLVWLPVVDEFILGHTLPPEVFDAIGKQLLVGGGARRDGGRGLLTALDAAVQRGVYINEGALAAATEKAARALQLDAGEIATGKLADLAVWDADDAAGVLPPEGKALQMTIVGGRVVLARAAWEKRVFGLKPFSKNPGWLCVIDKQ